LLAASILMVNNVRDIDTDRRAGKRTLAVRLGRQRARRIYAAALALAFAATMAIVIAGQSAWLLLACGSFVLAAGLVRTVNTRVDGPSLNRALAGTGQLLAAYSLLLSAGLLLS
jgi:1,4-dihydroxy-2-naphthoate octaprenyltransferase